MQNPGLNAHGGALQAWLAASGLYNGGASNGLSERRLPVGLHEMVAAHAAMTAHPSFAQGSSLLSSRLPSRPNNGAPLAATEAAAAALSAVAAGTLGAGGLGGAPAASTSADSLHSDSSLGSSVGTAAGAIDPLRRRQLLQQQHQQRSHQLLQQLPGGNSMFRPDAPSEAPAVAATLATLDDVTGGADDALGGVEGRYETHMLRMVEACRMRAHCLRLEPGDDLLAKLRAFVVERQIDAAVVLTCVGSTATTTLRPAAAAAPKVFEGAHDIVSLTGTIGRAGHNLRLSVCDEECRVVGGHAMEGCLVRTTAEVCLGLIDGVAFVRRHDARTGHTELSIEAANGRRAPSGASTTALVPAGAPPPKRRKTDAEHLIDYMCPVCGRNGVTAVDKETSKLQVRGDHKDCVKVGGSGRPGTWLVKGGSFTFRGIGPPACQTCTPADAQCLHSVEIRPRCRPAATPGGVDGSGSPLSLGGSPGDFGGVGGGGGLLTSTAAPPPLGLPSPLGVASMAAPDEPEAVKGLLEAANSPIYHGAQEG